MSCSDCGGVRAPVLYAFVVAGAVVPTGVGVDGGGGGAAPRCTADDGDPYSSLSSLSSVSDGGSAAAAHRLPSSYT